MRYAAMAAVVVAGTALGGADAAQAQGAAQARVSASVQVVERVDAHAGASRLAAAGAWVEVATPISVTGAAPVVISGARAATGPAGRQPADADGRVTIRVPASTSRTSELEYTVSLIN